MLGTMHQQVLVRVNGIWKLVHLEERMPNVPHDLEANCLHVVGDLVESHAVHLDGSSPLLLFEVDVAHVDAESSTKWILLVFDNLSVNSEIRFVIVVVCLVLNCQVEANSIG